MNPVVLVPVKEHAHSKQRLARWLDAGKRTDLSRTMWLDVAAALSGLSCPVAIVTDCREAAATAHEQGWRVIEDEARISESAAVDHASLKLADAGFDTVLRLPADIPLVTTADIELLFAGIPDTPCARLVPSRDGTGTNALLRSPPDLFPSRFGPNSLVLHRQECRRARAEPELVRNARIGLDIDEAEDLRALLEAGGSTATHRKLIELGIDRELEALLHA